MKTIIVPVDFSEDSLNALDHALNIAKKSKAHVRMVNVIKTGGFDFFRGVEKVGTKGDLEELVNKHSDEVWGNLDYKVRKGKVAREVVEEAKESKASLIVMGAHGQSGFDSIWMGSTAYRVVTEAPCAVITIRKDIRDIDFDLIVMPIDTSFESRQKIPATMDLARIFNSQIHVVGVCLSADGEEEFKVKKYLKQTTKLLEENGMNYKQTIIKGKNKSKLAMEYAEEIRANLISIMTEQESDFSNLLMGSFAQQMVHQSTIPVMSNRPREDLVVKTFLK